MSPLTTGSGKDPESRREHCSVMDSTQTHTPSSIPAVHNHSTTSNHGNSNLIVSPKYPETVPPPSNTRTEFQSDSYPCSRERLLSSSGFIPATPTLLHSAGMCRSSIIQTGFIFTEMFSDPGYLPRIITSKQAAAYETHLVAYLYQIALVRNCPLTLSQGY